jgi:hypothetical protein
MRLDATMRAVLRRAAILATRRGRLVRRSSDARPINPTPLLAGCPQTQTPDVRMPVLQNSRFSAKPAGLPIKIHAEL